jgi:hypothetical protein
MNGMGELLRFGQRGYVCQCGKTTLKFNGAIQTRETGKLLVPSRFSRSPSERQQNQRLISKILIGVQQLSNKRLRTGMDFDEQKAVPPA